MTYEFDFQRVLAYWSMSTAMQGIGLDKKSTELKGWIERWVRTNLKNGKLNDIYEKHHGSPLPDNVLSAGK